MRISTKTALPAAIVVACLFSCSIAEAKKPGGGGGDGGSDKGPSYQIIKLDTDDGAGGTLSGNAFDINDSRLVVGSANVLAAYWSVTVVDGEFLSELHFLDNSAFTNSIAQGCNEWGEIVGAADDALAAVYWASTASAAVELQAPQSFRGAEAINNSGVICGWSASGFDLKKDEQKALAWRFTDGVWNYIELTPLGDPGLDENDAPLPDRAYAVAISDADADTGVITIAGESNGNAVIWTVVLEDNGGLLAGPAMILDLGTATGVNVTGTACGSTGAGVVWVNGGQADPLALDESKTWGSPQTAFPTDINDNGVLVGDNGHAVMWPNKDASLVVLDDFLPRRRSPFFSLSSAHAVNEANEIVGAGSPDGSSVRLPYLAIPK